MNGGVIEISATNGTGSPGIEPLYKPRGTTNEAYMHYLIIAAPDWDGPVTSCTIDANTYNKFTGAIYAPHCDIQINGSSDTPPDGINSQIIGYNVTINGSANLYINYDASLNPYITDYPKTGIAR